MNFKERILAIHPKHLLIFIFSALVWASSVHPAQGGKSDPIRFAPLPMQNRTATTTAFLPMLRHLESQLGRPIELVYYDRHEQILNAFKAGDIQLVFLGPLPYLTLMHQSVAIEPIVFFLEETGLAKYRCALIAFAEDQNETTPQSELKIGLTQPFSTCGYLGAKSLLLQWQGLDLDNLDYIYLGTHEKVALEVVAGKVNLGTVKDEFVIKFAELGISALAYSDWLPATGIFANAELLGQDVVAEIRAVLLATPALVYRNWGSMISHGMVQLSDIDLQSLYALGDPLSIPLPPTTDRAQ